MKSFFLFLLLCITVISQAIGADLSKNYTPTRGEWLEAKISSYLSGFQSYEYAVLIVEDTVRLSIYITNESERTSGEKTLKRWTNQTMSILENYEWSKDMKVHTEIYLE